MKKFINYNQYLDISKKVKKIVIVSLNNLNDDKKSHIVLCSIAHHLILDLYKLTKSTYELDLVKKKIDTKENFTLL